MYLHCQSDISSTKMMATIPGYPDPVWYAEEGIENLLSLSKVTRHYNVTYNSDKDNTFTAHKDNPLYFTETSEGLFHIDTSQDNVIILATRVKDMRDQYTSIPYSKDKLAHKLELSMGYFATKTFIHQVDHRLISN